MWRVFVATSTDQAPYLDSSIALRTILDAPKRQRLQSWMQTPGTTLISSRLLRTEVIRVLMRDGRSLVEGRHS